MNNEKLKAFAASYPEIYHFLDTVIHPDVDGYNLIELLHRVMERGQADATRRLVDEFQALSSSGPGQEQVVELFNLDVPEDWQVINPQNCQAMLRMIAQYLKYLYTECGVKGRKYRL